MKKNIDCIFCKIRDREIEKEFLYEDDDVMAFYDIHPLKPVHVLVIPKKHVEDFLHVEDDPMWSKIRKVAQKMVRQHKLENKGFKVAINGGGAQDINHLHMHIVGPVDRGVKI